MVFLLCNPNDIVGLVVPYSGAIGRQNRSQLEIFSLATKRAGGSEWKTSRRGMVTLRMRRNLGITTRRAAKRRAAESEKARPLRGRAWRSALQQNCSAY